MPVPDSLFHGEFASADASALTETAARILLYPIGSTSVYTVLATDTVVITDICVNSTAAITVTLYDGANNALAAGETIYIRAHAATSGHQATLMTPHYCQVGTWPKVAGSGAGQIYVQIRGYVRSGV